MAQASFIKPEINHSAEVNWVCDQMAGVQVSKQHKKRSQKYRHHNHSNNLRYDAGTKENFRRDNENCAKMESSDSRFHDLQRDRLGEEMPSMSSDVSQEYDHIRQNNYRGWRNDVRGRGSRRPDFRRKGHQPPSFNDNVNAHVSDEPNYLPDVDQSVKSDGSVVASSGVAFSAELHHNVPIEKGSSSQNSETNTDFTALDKKSSHPAAFQKGRSRLNKSRSKQFGDQGSHGRWHGATSEENGACLRNKDRGVNYYSVNSSEGAAYYGLSAGSYRDYNAVLENREAIELRFENYQTYDPSRSVDSVISNLQGRKKSRGGGRVEMRGNRSKFFDRQWTSSQHYDGSYYRQKDHYRGNGQRDNEHQLGSLGSDDRMVLNQHSDSCAYSQDDEHRSSSKRNFKKDVYSYNHNADRHAADRNAADASIEPLSGTSDPFLQRGLCSHHSADAAASYNGESKTAARKHPSARKTYQKCAVEDETQRGKWN